MESISSLCLLKNNKCREDFLWKELIWRLLKCFDLSKFHEYRDYVITQLIFDTGMRLGECFMIRNETDINFNERTIFYY